MIKISWTQLKQILNSSGGQLQWFQDDNSYTIFDSSLTFTTTIQFYSPESPDQLDFEKNYKTTSGYSAISSYSCATMIQPATTPTDVLTISGNSSTTIRLSKITISGRNLLPTTATVSLIARSSADTGGTYTNPSIVPHDPNAMAASAIVSTYTANPTLGNSIGILRTSNLEFPNTGGNSVPLLVWDFSTEILHRPVLRNGSQQFCINLGGTSVSVIHISIEWTEET